MQKSSRSMPRNFLFTGFFALAALVSVRAGDATDSPAPRHEK